MIGAGRQLLILTGGFRAVLRLAIAIAAAQVILLAPIPLLVRQVFDQAIPKRDVAGIVLAGLLLLGLYGAGVALATAARRRAVRVTKASVADLRLELMRRLYALPPSWHDAQDPGLIHATLVIDAERVDALFTQLALSVAPAALIAVGLGVVALVVDPLLAGVVVALVLVLVLAARPASKRARQRAQEWNASWRSFSTRMRVAVRSMPLAKAQSAEQWELGRRARDVAATRDAATSFALAQSAYGAAFHAAAGLIAVVILVVGGIQVTDHQLSTGGLLSVYAVGALLTRQLASASPSFTGALADAASIERQKELWTATAPQPYAGNTRPPSGAVVALKGVTFGYASTPVLRAVDFELAPGEHVALLGPNGSGKSTLVSLMLGLYRPDRGVVTVGGIPLDEVDVATFRRRVGVALQDPIMTPGTVRENIAYGQPDASDADVAAAAYSATADEVIASLPQGLDSEVGDEGRRLSGGQRQRLAIARALVGRPSIVVLDEPTAHLDSRAIEVLLERLSELPDSPAVLLVTHDPLVARAADRIVHLRDGRIVSGEAEGHAVDVARAPA